MMNYKLKIMKGQKELVLFISLISSFIILNSSLSFSAPGSTTANYLKVDVGARPVAMGGNQFGAENDSFAQFYNPAFLANLSQKEISFMHNQFFQEFRQELFSYVHPTEHFGNFAGAFNHFSYGKIDGYTKDGLPTGKLSADDSLAGLSWGKNWGFEAGTKRIENIATGATVKFMRKTLANKSAVGYAADLGIAYKIQWQKLEGVRLAAAIQNLGSGLKFESETNRFPQLMKFGGAYSFWGSAITVAADGIMPADGSFYPALGFEYKLLQMFSVRVGYNGNKNLDKNLTYGVGFENPRFGLDYAFIPFGDLGDTHRISARLRFGKNIKQPRAEGQLYEKVKNAKTLYAQGLLVDAYLIAVQVQHVAPWFRENNKLLATLQKDFKEVRDSHKKAELLVQVESIFANGEKFFEEGNLINARLEFQAVLGLQPEHKAAQGYIKRIEGQFESFVQNFYQNGMVAFASENYELAKEEFEKVLTIKPDHEEAKAQIARCTEILEKKQKEAKSALQQDVLSKSYREALNAYKKDDLERAISLFREVLKIDPKHEDSQRYLSLCRETLSKRYLDMGREAATKGEWKSAMKHLTNAVEFDPSSKEAKSLLQDVGRRWDLQKKVLSQNLYKEGLEAFLNGDKKKAKSFWEDAVEMDPENEEARRGLGRIVQ